MTLFKKIAVAAVSAMVLAGSLGSANALPLPAAPSAPAVSDVTNVQYYRERGPGRWRGDGPRRGYYSGGPRRGWYGDHRGYRDYRRGYRRHNDGYWYPLAAFGAGAIIGGAIAAPRYVEPAPAPVYRSSGGGLNPRHYEYCAGRYRSYDSYSNTFQPYNGPRQQCYSPYY